MNVQMEQQNVAGIQGVLTLEVITIVNVFLDTKVMVSHVEKKMPVPMEVTIVIHMHIVSAKRTKKVKSVPHVFARKVSMAMAKNAKILTSAPKTNVIAMLTV